MKDDVAAPYFTPGHWAHGGKNLVIKSTSEPLRIQPRRIKGVIAEVCPVCAYPTDSDQHVNHCGG